ncbi:MAG: STAS domain-containing protein [Gammaproteobacteria bacterium]|nr:STAS domain-containing protein [Gammaproteobacteria bacterium]
MSIVTDKSESGKDITIKIDGRFDFSSHHEFRDAYRGASEAGTSFVLDMTNTEYMDSSALGMILLLKEHSGTLGGDIKIINANAEVKNILQIANFDKLFSIS